MSDSEIRLRYPAVHCVIIGDPEQIYPATQYTDVLSSVDDIGPILSVSVPLSGYHTIKMLEQKNR